MVIYIVGGKGRCEGNHGEGWCEVSIGGKGIVCGWSGEGLGGAFEV